MGHALAVHRPKPDASFRNEKDLPGLPRGLPHRKTRHRPFLLRGRNGTAERQGKGLAADRAPVQMQRDHAPAGFRALAPMIERRPADRLDLEPARQFEAETEKSGPRDRDVQIHRHHQPVVPEGQHLAALDSNFRSHRRDLQRDPAALVAVAKSLLQRRDRFAVRRSRDQAGIEVRKVHGHESPHIFRLRVGSESQGHHADLARRSALHLQPDVVDEDRGAVVLGAGDGDLELARQPGEFGVEARRLPDQLGRRAGILDLVRGDP